MPLHKALNPGDIHPLQNFEYADAAARIGASVTSADIGKVALQQDTDAFWLLKDTTPTWIEIGAGGEAVQTSREHYLQLSDAIQTILKDLDGYASASALAGEVATQAEHYVQRSETIQTILKDLDGYTTSAQGSDGYVAFFTGSDSIAGDNDFYWDRENNKLGVGISPTAKLDVAGGYFRARADGTNNPPTSGKGVEIVYSTLSSQDLGYILAYDRDGSSWKELRIEAGPLLLNAGNGNDVAIGTTSASYKLDVYESTNGLARLRMQNPNTGSSAYADILVQSDVSNPALTAYGSNYSGSVGGEALAGLGRLDFNTAAFISVRGAAAPLNFVMDRDSATEPAVTFTGDGTVGIGAIDPDGVFEVRKDQNALTRIRFRNLDSGASARADLFFYIDTGGGAIITAYGSGYSGSYGSTDVEMAATTDFAGWGIPLMIRTAGIGHPIHFLTSNTYAGTISGLQHWGIKTRYPHEALTVNGIVSLAEQAVSPADFDGYGALFVKTDDKLYFRDDGGTEYDLTAGGVAETTVMEHYAQHSDAIDTIRKDLDGYVTSAQGSDGYVAFFTGPDAIAGDNDLFYDRVNGRLGINTTSPINSLDILGTAVIGSTYAGAQTAPSNGLLVEGNVGIGTTSTSNALQVGASDGTAPAGTRQIIFANGNAYRGMLKLVSNKTTDTGISYMQMWTDTVGWGSYIEFRVTDDGSATWDWAVGVNTYVSAGTLGAFRISATPGSNDASPHRSIESEHKIVIEPTGEVGIGKWDPATPLDVSGIIHCDDLGIGTTTVPHGGTGIGILALEGPEDSADGPHIQFTINDNNYPTMQIFNWDHDNNAISFDAFFDGSGWKASDTTCFQIYKSQDKLHIRYDTSSAGGVAGWSEGITLQSDGKVSIGSATAANKFDVEGAVAIGTSYAGSQTAPTNGLIVEGDVGIGTNAPGVKLDTVGTIRTTGQTTPASGVGMEMHYQDELAFIMVYDRDATEYKPFTIAASKITLGKWGGAHVGIGTHDPHERLTINGIVSLQEQDNYDRTHDGYGSLWAKSDGKLYFTNDDSTEYDLTAGASDKRLKNTIETVENALDKTLALRGVTFEWNEQKKGKGTQMGLIAQEVEAVVPELVFDDKLGFKNIKHHQLTGLFVEAIKDLKNENEDLRKRLSALEDRLNA